METYVITGELAYEFRQYLLAKDAKYVQRFEDFAVNKKKATIAGIKVLVSRKYLDGSIPIETRSNGKDVVRARHLAFYLSRKLTRCSLPEIGRYFGNKHHTTVMHGIDKITGELMDNPILAAEVAELERELTK